MIARRILREIGRHPVAGLCVIGQTLVPLVCLIYSPRGDDRGAFGWSFEVVLMLLVLQLPASVAVFPVASSLPGPSPFEDQEMFRWLTAQAFLAACANYPIWAYALPALSRRIEARWPWQRPYPRCQSLSSNQKAR
jgi:hypothetical protein